MCEREEGAPPSVDLIAEKRNGDFVRGLIRGGFATAVHDISDGGLLVALAEMAMAGHVGASLEDPPEGMDPYAWWFGEDQARYVVTVPSGQAAELIHRAEMAGVPAVKIGKTGGDRLLVPDDRPIVVEALRDRHETWLPIYMGASS